MPDSKMPLCDVSKKTRQQIFFLAKNGERVLNKESGTENRGGTGREIEWGEQEEIPEARSAVTRDCR